MEHDGRIHDPLAPIPPSRHPFQFWTLTAGFISGWVTLIEDPDTAISRIASSMVTTVWGLLLVISTSTALISAWWPDRITGLLMERAALTFFGAGSLIYGGLLIWEFGAVGAATGSITIAAGVASLWRVRHIGREMAVLVRLLNARHRLLAQMENLSEEEDGQ